MPDDHSLWAGEEFSRRRNWLDFGRALSGGTAVYYTLPTLIQMWINVPGVHIEQVVMMTQAVILLAGVAIQMIRVEERLTLFPPVFYICGLALPVIGIKAGLIAFAAIWAINIILPNPGVFLTAYAGGVVILSIMVGRGTQPAIVMAALAAFPPLVSVLFRRRLAQYRKRTKIVVR
ncbi:hypothetical protein [Synoicihabitans lomoniglobus]|nr:hypothetical protein [Opitutaceae bacterium LMO-M01]